MKNISTNKTKPFSYLLLFIKFIIIINFISNSNTSIMSSNKNTINLLNTSEINLESNNKKYSFIQIGNTNQKKSKSHISKFKKLFKNHYNAMKKNIKKNGRGIKKCGLDFLTEVYCQFYKKNYNENLNNCRKLKSPDFKKNCSNLKSIYVLFFVKSALNTFSTFSKTKIKKEINARKIYKTILSKLFKPFRNCSEIPNEIKHDMLKKQMRIIYNKKQLKHLSKSQKNNYDKLYKQVKKILRLLNSDLIAIDPKDDKLKCKGIINGAKTIVKYFSNIKTK